MLKVVRTCGPLMHNRELVPNGLADRVNGIATVSLAGVLAAMEPA